MTHAAFAFEASSPEGRISRGILQARNREDALRDLSARGLTVLALNERGSPARRSSAAGERAVVQGLRALTDLVRAGLPLGSVLATLEFAAPPAWRSALPEIREALSGGKPLSEALSTSGLGISPVTLALIRAGEASGDLARALERATADRERNLEIKTSILAALAYPAVLLVAGLSSAGFIVAVILPRFAALLGDLGQELPPSTRLVLAASGWLRVGIVPVTITIGIAIALSAFALRERAVRVRVLEALLRLPVIGALQLSLGTTRAISTLGALLASGVPAGRALGVSGEASGNEAIASRFVTAAASVRNGSSISAALASASAVTPAVARFARAGEDAGTLPQVLERAAQYEGAELVRRTRSLVRLIEPSLILGFGGLVALISAALLQALYAARP